MAEPWVFWALVSAAFAAATAILSKVGLRGVDPDAAQLVRTAFVLVAVGLLVAATGRWRGAASFTRANWAFLALAGLATAASWVCYFRALAVGDASRVAVVDKLSVPMVAVVAVLLFSERLGVQGWLGVALAAVGAALVSLAK
jgi:bacterial/archaeal transporter family protein